MSIVPGKIIAQEEIKSSSSDNIYTVILYDNCISCNCPAGGRKTFCKHMQKIIFDNADILNSQNSYFANRIRNVLELKNDKSANKEELKQACSDIIYVNKDIANSAFINALKTKPSIDDKLQKEKEIKRYIDLINEFDIHDQFAFFNLLSAAYSNYHLGFRYTEKPVFADLMLKLGCFEDCGIQPIKGFKKMDKGRKSLYFYKFTDLFIPYIRAVHKELSVKFPKVVEYIDKENDLYIEKRIIDPKYL